MGWSGALHPSTRTTKGQTRAGPDRALPVRDRHLTQPAPGAAGIGARGRPRRIHRRRPHPATRGRPPPRDRTSRASSPPSTSTSCSTTAAAARSWSSTATTGAATTTRACSCTASSTARACPSCSSPDPSPTTSGTAWSRPPTALIRTARRRPHGQRPRHPHGRAAHPSRSASPPTPPTRALVTGNDPAFGTVQVPASFSAPARVPARRGRSRRHRLRRPRAALPRPERVRRRGRARSRASLVPPPASTSTCASSQRPAGSTAPRSAGRWRSPTRSRPSCAALEQQYDTFLEGRQQRNLLATDLSDLPTADELGAEFEAFLKDVTEDDEQGDEARPQLTIACSALAASELARGRSSSVRGRDGARGVGSLAGATDPTGGAGGPFRSGFALVAEVRLEPPH